MYRDQEITKGPLKRVFLEKGNRTQCFKGMMNNNSTVNVEMNRGWNTSLKREYGEEQVTLNTFPKSHIEFYCNRDILKYIHIYK